MTFGRFGPNKVDSSYQLACCYSMAASVWQVNKTSLRFRDYHSFGHTRRVVKKSRFHDQKLPGIVILALTVKCYQSTARTVRARRFHQRGLLCAAMQRSSS